MASSKVRVLHQRDRRPESKARTYGQTRARVPVDEILHLQRLAGNGAVAELLVVQRDMPVGPRSSVDPIGLNALVWAVISAGEQVGASVGPLLRAIGVDATGSVIQILIANGYGDESKLTDIAFWIHHPDLAGSKLNPRLPGFGDLRKEWIELRATVVQPGLAAAKSHKGPTPEPAPATKAQEPKPSSPTEPAAGPAPADLVHDWARSTLELLPAAKRAKFEAVEWGPLDFPGTKVYLKSLKPDEIEWYRTQSSVKQETDRNGDYFVGVNQQLAGELFLALSYVRPGTGERRVNITDNAVIPQDAFNKSEEDKKAFYAYVVSELKPIPGQEAFQLNHEAADKFAEMREAAKADGIPIIAMSTFRTLEHEVAAAKAAGNPNAVGGISHLIGLAADVKLHINAKTDPRKFGEASTNMPRMVDMLHSPIHKWIFMNGAQFGFYEYRQEPWHWEYNPPGFRERFYAKAPDLKAKAEEALAAARPKPKKK